LIYNLAKEQFITVLAMAASKKSSISAWQLTQKSYQRGQIAWSYSQGNTRKYSGFYQECIFNSEPINLIKDN